MRANEGRDTKQGVRQFRRRQNIAGDRECFIVGESEVARDVVRSALVEGGATREDKVNKGQGLGREKGSEQGETGQLHQDASADRVSDEGGRRDER